MSASVWVNFSNGKAGASPVFVVLTGATVVPDANDGVSLQLATAVTNISVAAGQVGFATGPDALFNGSLKLLISWAGGTTPQVTLNNLENGSELASVSWPTASGRQTELLAPGNPVSLSGIVSS